MIIVDSSVWIDHWRRSNRVLIEQLDAKQVLIHPFVIGELAVGNLHDRRRVLSALDVLPRPVIATAPEILDFIERHRLFGLGIGYVDAHLVAAARLTPDATLWTNDLRLRDVARRLAVAADF